MIDLCIDKNGDLNISNGTISKTKSVAQKVSILLNTFKGEWFLDETIGIPYFQSIFGKKIKKEKIDLIFTSQISSVDGVKKILSFSSDIIDRKYSFKVEFLSNENTIEVVEKKI